LISVGFSSVFSILMSFHLMKMMSSCLLGWAFDCVASGFIVGVRACRNCPICWYHLVMLDFVFLVVWNIRILFVLTGIFSPLLFWIFKILSILRNKSMFLRLKMLYYVNTVTQQSINISTCVRWTQTRHSECKSFIKRIYRKTPHNPIRSSTFNLTVPMSPLQMFCQFHWVKVVSILWTHLVHWPVRLVEAMSEITYFICNVDK
jgi:hypothetical protein